MSNSNLEQGSVTEFGAHLINNIEWGSLPEPVSWMPATTAWYVLFLAMIAFIVGYLAYRYIGWLKRAYLRQADRLVDEYSRTMPDRLGHLVKRVANHRWPEAKVGMMSAADFAQFLEIKQGDKALSTSCCVALFNATYQPNGAVSDQTILDVKHWIGAMNV